MKERHAAASRDNSVQAKQWRCHILTYVASGDYPQAIVADCADGEIIPFDVGSLRIVERGDTPCYVCDIVDVDLEAEAAS